MKRIHRLCALCTALIAVVMFLSGCTGFNDSEFVNDVQIYYSQLQGYAYAGDFMWNGDPTQVVMDIPDYYKIYPVEQLGGYFGTGLPIEFGIIDPSMYDESLFAGVYDFNTDAIYDNIYYNGFGDDQPFVSASDAVIKPMNITVILRRNICRIEETLVPPTIFKEDDESKPLRILGYLYSSPEYLKENIFFLPVYYFVCSEDNETYYSENGRLYLRSDNSLVDVFTYWDSELLEYIPLSEE